MKKSHLLMSAVVVFATVLMSTPAYPQWSTNPTINNAICAATGNQETPTIVSDDSGGAIITWDDTRNGSDNDIYAQRINASGAVQWTTNGVAIDTATGNQTNPTIVSDGSGGAIITWEDLRNGTDYDIYAQRINASGTVQWTTNGVAICATTGDQTDPTIVSDGSGGAIITWEDFRNGTDFDIYAQRINASGTVQWTTNGVAICTATGSQYNPTIASDGSGGAIITWYDSRNGTDFDIYAQRINASGTVRWTTNGVAICTATGSQYNPTIVSDGSGGAIITWQDYRNGTDYDIYAQRINASGTVQWTANGVAICTATAFQTAPTIVSDGSGGAIITWIDYRNGADDDIYTQRINSSGTVQWTANGVAICTTTGSQESPTLVSDGTGGAIITWEDFRNGTDFDIYAQRINASGTVRWTANGVAISTATGTQQIPTIVGDGSGGAIIAWEDYRNGTDYNIYAERVDQVGYLYAPPPWITTARDVANDQGGQMRILWNPSGHDVSPNSIVQTYTVWMGVKSTGLMGKTSLIGKNSRLETIASDTLYWEPAGTIPAKYQTGYNALVATAADSGPQGIPWYYFKVIANTSDPTVFWTSNVDSGYSVDNLPPGAPASLAGNVSGDSVRLHWAAAIAPDLWGYQVYRSTSPFENPSFASLTPYATTVDTSYIDKSPLMSSQSYYVVLAKDIHGNLSLASNEISIVLTNVEPNNSLPTAYGLNQNYPNPFNPATEIGYQLKANSFVTLKVYDALGREVTTLVNGEQRAGSYSVTFDGSRLSSGVYLYRLVAITNDGNRFESIKKLVLMK